MMAAPQHAIDDDTPGVFSDLEQTVVMRHWRCRKELGQLERVGGGWLMQYCDGEMIGTCYDDDWGEWDHKCDKCGRAGWAKSRYPKVIYRPADPRTMR
jgi:hypothetical protein